MPSYLILILVLAGLTRAEFAAVDPWQEVRPLQEDRPRASAAWQASSSRSERTPQAAKEPWLTS